MSIFKIMGITGDNGEKLWAVCRRDEKVIEDGIVSYNFNEQDWQLAIDCRLRLESRFSN